VSDHCRRVSTPRWARASANVTSSCQRLANGAMMSAGSGATSVLKKACGSRLPSGSLTSTRRTGRGGVPGRYRKAVSEAISRAFRVLWPYREDTMTLCHEVAGLVSGVFSFGRGGPFRAGRPKVRAVRGGGGAKRLASRRNRLMRVAREAMTWAGS
jgi:hypothetical protein